MTSERFTDIEFARIVKRRHRVVAGRMAVTFTSVLVVGCLLVAVTTGHPAARVVGLP